MKVYTKTGDKGQTSLVGGQRVSKCCQRLESYGTVDELNAHVGLLITYLDDYADKKFLLNIQSKLFIVGGYLATDNTTTAVREGNMITADMISEIETEIDRLQAMVPLQKMFILPGGSKRASYSHVCRTVCRRCEREILRLVESGVTVDENLLAYMNRLSDYFFVLARKQNQDAGVAEVVWERQSQTEKEED